MSESTTGGPPAQPCGICSNGPSLVYHYGGPCPYTYTAGTFVPPGARGIDTGEIHRAPLLRKIAELEAEIEQLRAASFDVIRRIEEWETAVRTIIGRQPGHGMDLTQLRDALHTEVREENT